MGCDGPTRSVLLNTMLSLPNAMVSFFRKLPGDSRIDASRPSIHRILAASRITAPGVRTRGAYASRPEHRRATRLRLQHTLRCNPTPRQRILSSAQRPVTRTPLPPNTASVQARHPSFQVSPGASAPRTCPRWVDAHPSGETRSRLSCCPLRRTGCTPRTASPG